MSLYSGKQLSRSGYQGSIGSLIGRVGGLIGRTVGKVAGITSKLPIPGAGVIGAVGGGIAGVLGAGRAISRVMPVPPSLPLLPGGGAGILQDMRNNGFTMQKNGQPRRIRKDGRPYKQPRMNSANPRALKRAIRRVVRFGQLARAVGYGRPPKAIKNVKSPRKGR